MNMLSHGLDKKTKQCWDFADLLDAFFPQVDTLPPNALLESCLLMHNVCRTAPGPLVRGMEDSGRVLMGPYITRLDTAQGISTRASKNRQRQDKRSARSKNKRIPPHMRNAITLTETKERAGIAQCCSTLAKNNKKQSKKELTSSAAKDGRRQVR